MKITRQENCLIVEGMPVVLTMLPKFTEKLTLALGYYGHGSAQNEAILDEMLLPIVEEALLKAFEEIQ